MAAKFVLKTLPFSDVIPDGMYHIITRCNIDVLKYISPIARSPQSTNKNSKIRKGGVALVTTYATLNIHTNYSFIIDLRSAAWIVKIVCLIG